MAFYKSVVLSLFFAFLLSACGGGDDGVGFANGLSGNGTSTTTDNGSYRGTIKIGNGFDSAFKSGVVGAESTNLKAGESTILTITLVDENNVPIQYGENVTFSSNCISLGLATLTSTRDASYETNTTFSDGGTASIRYTSSGCSGTDVITATIEVFNYGDPYVYGDSEYVTLNAKTSLNIAVDQVLALQFISNSQNDLSIKGSGLNEVSVVTFKLIGAQGAPVVGELISFALSPATGGASLARDRDTAVTNNKGEVTTTVQSGTSAGTVTVIATHVATNVKGASGGINISTGVATDDRFSVGASDFAPPDAFNVNGVKVDIVVIASDQFGNPLPDNTAVSFVSPESGQIQSSCKIASGECKATWKSADAYKIIDGKVSVMAFMQGAEQFFDTNGNNIYDSGDTGGFVDIGEPCADTDSNGICDPATGDFFKDTNLNGAWDGPDGVWNGPCLAALNGEPILTSIGATAICNTPELTTISRTLTLYMSTNSAEIIALGTFPAERSKITITGTDTHTFTGMFIGDANGNPLPTGSTIRFTNPGGDFIFAGATEFVVENQRPTGPINLSIISDGAATSNGRLLLKVDLPGNAIDAEFEWTVID